MKNFINKWFSANKYQCKIYKNDYSCISFCVDSKSDVEDYIDWISSNGAGDCRILRNNTNSSLIQIDKKDINKFEYRKTSNFNINLSKTSVIQSSPKKILTFIISMIVLYSIIIIGLSVPNITMQYIYKSIQLAINFSTKTSIIFFLMQSFIMLFNSFQEDNSISIIYSGKTVISQLLLLTVFPFAIFTLINLIINPASQFVKNILLFLLVAFK